MKWLHEWVTMFSFTLYFIDYHVSSLFFCSSSPCLQVLIHVIDKKTWKLVKTRYVTEAFFFMHVANAYEEGEHIVLDIPTYKDSTLLHHLYIYPECLDIEVV